MTPHQKNTFKIAFRKAAESADLHYEGDKRLKSAPLNLALSVDEETGRGKTLLELAEKAIAHGESVEAFAKRCFKSAPPATSLI